MARLHFTVGTRYLYNGQVYVISELLLDNKIVAKNQSFPGSVTLTQEELTELWMREEIRFEVHGRYVKKEPNAPLSVEYTIADFQQLPSSRRDEAKRRYEIIRPLLDIPPEERTRTYLEEYASKLASRQEAQPLPLGSPKPPPRKGKHIGQAVGRSSIEMWLRAFVESGYDIRSLVPATDQHGGRGKTRVDDETESIIKSVMEECKSHPKHRTIEDVHYAIVNRIADANKFLPSYQQLTPPGITTTYRRINAEGKASILRRRASRLEAQVNNPVYRGPKPTRILERVEIDDTTLDLIVVDLEDRLPIGRPTLMYAIDAYSGFPCGFYVGFEPPSYLAVQNCLLHSILPKQDCQQRYGTKHSWPVYGLPETLIVDNGKHYICRNLEDSCGQLGINIEQMPIRTPWFKGRIERFFRTNNTGFIHSLPGTTFSNIVERGDYDSQKYACISLTAFLELLHVFLLDKYTQEWHDGIGKCGGIPAKLWEENLQSGFIPPLHEDARELRFILYPGEYRTIQNTGIDFESLRYQHPSLAAIRSRHLKKKQSSYKKEGDDTKDDRSEEQRVVHIKYNPSDIGTLYVYDDDKHTWLDIPAIDPEYAKGLSIWKHRVIRKYILRQKKPVNIFELAAAKQHMREIIEREYALTRKSRGRKKGARFLGIDVAQAVSPEHSQPITAEGKALEDIKKDSAQEHKLHKPLHAVPQVDDTTNPPTQTEKKTRKRREKKNTSRADISPLRQAAPQEDLSAEGWGGDYGLPS
ncbi:hypothetical protein KSD_30110 [Ktedonobacter sp. SOSP1-85]|uniref:Mu transposase C-terminal domain-containing protein n=1 Tax=Ktedonobacter sp. SOSP1-85 TaxID=2778367 RepID=UPI001916B85A|nr:Mu transposase C-terminal domain-containing protein [Ktedonobacter sp. SOSP1-85]GHO75240.1 hypothetical protein KSD_30110 [Ktedonobacter sp. SOSP1-85]